MNEKRLPRPRREVTDADFRLAYQGNPADPESVKRAVDNRNVIRAVLKLYEERLPADSLEDCGLVAVWRTLQYHDPAFNQKFTTSLYRFVDWECKRELRQIYGRSKRKPLMFLPIYDKSIKEPVVQVTERDENLAHVRECMGLLPHRWQRQVVQQYYFDGMTMEQIGHANGYSKEAARQKVSKAVVALREICHVGL